MDDKEKELQTIGNKLCTDLKKEYPSISSVSTIDESTFKVYGPTNNLLKLKDDRDKKELESSFESDSDGTPYLLLK